MTFIDRQTELNFLEEKWQDPKAQLIVLWGKRRVGKTELVKQFIAGKQACIFSQRAPATKNSSSVFHNSWANSSANRFF